MTTNLFKKTLIAATLAGVSVGAVAGANVAVTPLGVSIEASQSANVLAANTITVTLDAEYAVGDVLTFAINGSAARSTSWPNTLTIAEVPESGAGVGDGIAGLTLGLLSGSSDGATYRVTDLADTSLNEDSTTVGADLVLAGLELLRNAVVAQAVTSVAYSAETQTGVSLDTTGPNLVGELAVAGGEFAAARIFNGSGRELGISLIAIEFARRAFANGRVTDTFQPALSQSNTAFRDARDTVGVAFDQGSSVDEATFTLNGDFSWIPNMDSPQTSVAAGGTCTIDFADDAVTASSITATATAAGTCAITLDLADGLPTFAPMAIEPQTFTYSLDLDYTDGGANYDGVAGQNRTVALATNAFAGAWALNSFSTTIGYMPYGSGISQIIYLTNTGGTVGDIFVDVWAEDGTLLVNDLNVGQTTPFGNTTLAEQVLNAIVDSIGSVPTRERVRIRIVADIPRAQGRVFSAYNVRGDRLATGNF